MTSEQVAVVSLIANLALVLVTTAYVVLTWRMARSAHAASQFAAESAAAARASLSIEFDLIALTVPSAPGASSRLRGILVSNTGSAAVYLHFVHLDSVSEFVGRDGEADVFVRKVVNAQLLPERGAPQLLHHWENVELNYEGEPVVSMADLVVGSIGYSISGSEPILERVHTESAAMLRFIRWRSSRSVPYPGSGNFPADLHRDPTRPPGSLHLTEL